RLRTLPGRSSIPAPRPPRTRAELRAPGLDDRRRRYRVWAGRCDVQEGRRRARLCGGRRRGSDHRHRPHGLRLHFEILMLKSGVLSTPNIRVQRRRYASIARDAVMSPRSRTCFHPKPPWRSAVILLFASLSLPAMKRVWSPSATFLGSVITWAFTVLSVL